MASHLLWALLALVATSAAHETQRSIVAELLDSHYTGFVKLLEQANLLEELDSHVKNHNGLTILPTTDHFLLNRVSPVLLSWLKRKENVPTLRRVLLNHFVPGQVHPDSWAGEMTLNGLKITHQSNYGLHYLGGVPVRKIAALKASDGIAHSLDGLLVPEDVKIELANFLDVSADDVVTGSVEGFSINSGIKLEMEADTPMSSHPPMSGFLPTLTPTPEFISSPTASPIPDPSSTPQEIPSSETPVAETPPTGVPAPVPFAPAPGPSSASLDFLIDFLNSTGNFSSFLQLLNDFGLGPALTEQLEKPTTILAPNDAAFSNLSESTLESLKASGNLGEVISYHVIDAYASTTDFLTGKGASLTPSAKAGTNSTVYYYPTLYPEQSLVVRVTDGVVTFGPQNALAVMPDLCEADKCGDLSVSGLNSVMIPDGLIAPAPAPAPSGSGNLSAGTLLTLLLVLVSIFAL